MTWTESDALIERLRYVRSGRRFSRDEMNARRTPDSAYSEDGVDLTLIRWMLSLTPAQRLEALQQYADSVLNVRAWNSET
jgi:hypothetical protein